MADNKKWRVAHFCYPAKINSILGSFSEKELVIPATKAMHVKEMKFFFLHALV